MEKPIIFYEVRPQLNRSTGETMLVPAIVEREQPVTLDEIIANAIDRGLIAGVKPTYAHQIAEAIAQQMYEEFKAGRGVKFGTYFYARLYLDGMSRPNGNLTDRNGVNVRFVNGNSFRLSRDMFTFSNVNGGHASVKGQADAAATITCAADGNSATVSISGGAWSPGDYDATLHLDIVKDGGSESLAIPMKIEVLV